MKEHWCPEYKKLQQNYNLSKKDEGSMGLVFGESGQGATSCDNEDLLAGAGGPFNGSSVGEDAVGAAIKKRENSQEMLNSHRKKCEACQKHFGI